MSSKINIHEKCQRLWPSGIMPICDVADPSSILSGDVNCILFLLFFCLFNDLNESIFTN